MTVYQQKYGSLTGICKDLSFNDLGSLAADTSAALTSDVPTFVRLNQTFGEHASTAWLYSHLKNLLARFLVGEIKIADTQIDFLADIIVNNHSTMKLTEFMLFENYFLGGRYEEFYGESSYILAITRSLQKFKKDLNMIYQQIERDKVRNKEVDKTPGVSWEEYCKANGMDGKPMPGTVNIEPIKIHTKVKKPSKLTEIQAGINYAHAVIENIFKLDNTGVNQMSDAFRKRYGHHPEEYLELHEIIEVED